MAKRRREEDGNVLEAPITISKEAAAVGRAGGIYIPPFKLARLEKPIEDMNSAEGQRRSWEALRKSINGLVNKVNVLNMRNIVEELFQENLIRGRGLFVRAVIRGQMASPGFTNVFAALVAVVNSKIKSIGDLVIRRIVLQYRRACQRNDRYIVYATLSFIGHLVNQRVVHVDVALYAVLRLLIKPSNDSVLVAVAFLKEVGATLQVHCKVELKDITDNLRTILAEGQIDRRTQQVVEGFFNVLRDKFKDNVAIEEGLDLVEEEDQNEHMVDIFDEEINGELTLNIFRVMLPEEFEEAEAAWKVFSDELLGVGVAVESDDSSSDSEEVQADPKATTAIKDYSEQDLVNLRRIIYLVYKSSLQAADFVHRILKVKMFESQKKEVCTMLIDCCAMENTYNKFFALSAQRLCELCPTYAEQYENLFGVQYATVHRLETNKLRNIAYFFAHLLFTDAIQWTVLSHVIITESSTTSSSRIFVKNLAQEISLQWGPENLKKRLEDAELGNYFAGLFPTDSVRNLKFSINFWIAVGLGHLTEKPTELLRLMMKKAKRDKIQE